jgi:hypothetical protein
MPFVQKNIKLVTNSTDSNLKKNYQQNEQSIFNKNHIVCGKP